MHNVLLQTIRPMSWWDMVSPREEEMPDFLHAYIGKGMQFRTPKRVWEDLWRLKRGDMNHILGMRKFGTITNFKGPKFQRGIICATAFGVSGGGGGTTPNLQNVTHTNSQIAPQQARIFLAYDSDGSLRFDGSATNAASITYADLTTQSDDSNTHTNDWWPDQPDVNEGLNWDIQYSNESSSGIGSHWLFHDSVVNRTTGTWYLLDTISNDHADGIQQGAIGRNRGNGTAKSPDSGSSNGTADIDIRTTGSGSSVAGHTTNFTVDGAA